jgi:hypothetical protein
MQRGMELTKDDSKGGLTRENIIVNVFMHAYFISYMLSGNNIDFCLGYK